MPAVCIARIATPIAAAASPVAALNQSGSAKISVRRSNARRIRISVRRMRRGGFVLHQSNDDASRWIV